MKAQNRGGKGIKGATSDEEDAIEHLFVSSTHNYLLFFTDRGRVHWLKVYDLPLQARTAKGRALVNVIALEDGERISNCFSVREFPDDKFLMIATQKGIVKKTALSAYGRPMKGGIIAIRLDDDDCLVDVRILEGDQDVVMSTSGGMAIRFNHEDARKMGRATRGVKGISLVGDEVVVGMVVADMNRTLLTVCELGYGKRTSFGSGITSGDDEEAESSGSSTAQYRRQRRGGKGLRDIKTSDRNGRVVDALAVKEDDEVLFVTAKGKIQRLRAADISKIGRNTQGVRIMKLDAGDTIASCARIAGEDIAEEAAKAVEASSSATVTDSASSESAPDSDVKATTDDAADLPEDGISDSEELNE